MAQEQPPHLCPGDMLIRANRPYVMVLGNTGPSLIDIGDQLVGVSGVVAHFKLANPMIVTRWVKAGLSHYTVAGRRLFRLDQVEAWLAEKGYDPEKLATGEGLVSSRKREGGGKWRKGAMSASGDKPVASKKRRGRSRK